jgi:hypothetical protein
LSLKFYLDHHVPAAITDGLRRRGVDVLTAYEDGTAELDDPDLLSRTTQLGRVLFSQDRDLLVLADQWLQAGRTFGGLVYAHQLSVTIGEAVRDLILIAQVLEPEDMQNHVEFIPL